MSVLSPLVPKRELVPLDSFLPSFLPSPSHQPIDLGQAKVAIMASNIRHIPEPSACSTAETVVEMREVSLDDDSLKSPLAEKHFENPQALPPVIPPTHQSRTLIVCFDGTGDQFDADNSNVVQFVSLLKKDDRNKQLVYYQVGCLTGSTLKSELIFTVDWNRDIYIEESDS
jgi:hypothetical protein